jgi:hypothetical protein
MIRTPPPGSIEMKFLEEIHEECYAKHGTSKYLLCDSCGAKYKFNFERAISRLQYMLRVHFKNTCGVIDCNIVHREG